VEENDRRYIVVTLGGKLVASRAHRSWSDLHRRCDSATLWRHIFPACRPRCSEGWGISRVSRHDRGMQPSRPCVSSSLAPTNRT
jgi:hypothetical protein